MGETAGPGARFFRFLGDGDEVITVFPESRKVLRGNNELDVGRSCFDLLLFLLQNPGRPIGQDELVKGAWPRVSVSLTTLRSHVSRLRSSIGTEVIATVKHGYQFAAAVEQVSNEAAQPPPPIPEPESWSALPPLPVPRGPLIGRDDDIPRLVELARQHRAVTVIGPGGVGKTSLVLEAARELAPLYPDGVVYIDLARARTPVAVATATARALGLSFGARTQLAQILAAAIGRRRLLLIYDTCEYVVAPVAELVTRLTTSCPGLGGLAVSQKVVPIPGAELLRLHPLTLDQAVVLFLARLGDQRTDLDLEAINIICRRVDALPLVIEMVAGVARSFGLARVRAGLADRFAMLSEPELRVGPERHQTLAAVLEWSYGLLGPSEQRAFRRLGVLAGTISGDAAIAILGAVDSGLSHWQLLTLLRRLADSSLIFAGGDGSEPRYFMLETVQQFALDKLAESGETEAAAAAHAQYFTELFHNAEIAAESMPDAAWLKAYAPELENARLARDWLLGSPTRLALTVKFLAGAGPLWLRLGLAAELRPTLEHVLVLLPEDSPDQDRAALLRVAGMLWRLADRARANSLSRQAADLYRKLADTNNLAGVLTSIGGDLNYFGQYMEAKQALHEAGAAMQAPLTGKTGIRLLNELGTCSLLLGELDDASRHFTAMRHVARQLKDSVREGIALFNLGEVEFRLDAVSEAIELATQSAAVFRNAGQVAYLGWPLLNTAAYYLLQGDAETARVHALEAFPLVSSAGGYWLRIFFQVWALITAREGHYQAAARLSGFVDAEYVRTGEGRQPLEAAVNDHLATLLSRELTSAEIAVARRQGGRWSEDDAAEIVRRDSMV
jgi:predicted ATPase/DNA-binding winged helix-turn-helix (wHTH) protein